MEKDGYRENLELLKEMFPGKGALSVKEVAAFLGAGENTVYSAINRRHNPATPWTNHDLYLLKI